jgi:agmatine deiminase
VNDTLTRTRVSAFLEKEGIPGQSLKLHTIPTNDAWIRDYGPNFLIRDGKPSRKLAANLWNFDSWGGKYEWEKDQQAGNEIVETLRCPSFEPGIVLEGGAIEVNGRGTCITTKQCLLNTNRNQGKTQEEMETYLTRFLGVSKVIWCQGDLVGDDTDGHIDNLVRFVSPNTVLCAMEDNPEDPNHLCTHDNWEILKSSTDESGKLLNVVRFPMPAPVVDQGTRLPASYANFYIGNSAILLPIYGGPRDEEAASILREFFPDRPVVQIPCKIFIWGLGGPHCVTQQQPAV